ncbi:eCIS core domain-containing protein [Deinococcus sp. ME38]|uniref:eCIS core domain-containing protein n=1 Tax=Deinococcus sp. ME38 TaxID=3400344 RepID=UPI003B5ACCEB
MSIFDERLRRLKHAGQMAVTQQDRAFMPGTLPSFSAAPALPVRGPVLPTVLPPARPGGPRRVQARLLALPAASPPAPPSRWPDVAHAAAPVAVPRPAPLAALTTAVAAPARQQDTAAWQPAAEASAAGPRADTAPHGDTVLHADPDPYGDYAEALAAGLFSTPPLGLLPPTPEPTALTAPHNAGEATGAAQGSPLRPASFLETLALNTRPDDRTADPLPASGPPRTLEVSPDAPVTERSIRPAPTAPEPAAQVTPPPTDHPAAAGDSATVPVSPAPAPASDSRLESSPTPRPVPMAEADDAPLSPSRTGVPAAPAGPSREAESSAAAPRTEPVSTAAVSEDSAASGSGEPSVDTGPPLVFPDVPTPEERERRDQERRELEALLRAGNNDIPVRLPRKPRPPGAAPRPREPEPEEVRPAPPIPADVSQNILARLNRFAELEAQGEVEASPLGFGELLNWRDHHPERNVAPEGDAAASPSAGLDTVPAVVQSGVPAPAAPDLPAAPRLRARASRSGRTARDRAAEPADTDEEPDRARPDAAPSSQVLPAEARPDLPRPVPVVSPAPTPEVVPPVPAPAAPPVAIRSPAARPPEPQPVPVSRPVLPTRPPAPADAPFEVRPDDRPLDVDPAPAQAVAADDAMPGDSRPVGSMNPADPSRTPDKATGPETPSPVGPAADDPRPDPVATRGVTDLPGPSRPAAPPPVPEGGAARPHEAQQDARPRPQEPLPVARVDAPPEAVPVLPGLNSPQQPSMRAGGSPAAEAHTAPISVIPSRPVPVPAESGVPVARPSQPDAPARREAGRLPDPPAPNGPHSERSPSAPVDVAPVSAGPRQPTAEPPLSSTTDDRTPPVGLELTADLPGDAQAAPAPSVTLPVPGPRHGDRPVVRQEPAPQVTDPVAVALPPVPASPRLPSASPAPARPEPTVPTVAAPEAAGVQQMAVPELAVPYAPLATTPPVPRTETREPARPVDSPGPFTPVPNAPVVPVEPHAAGVLPEVPNPALAAAPAATVVESMVAADGSWRPAELPAPVLPDVRPDTLLHPAVVVQPVAPADVSRSPSEAPAPTAPHYRPDVPARPVITAPVPAPAPEVLPERAVAGVPSTGSRTVTPPTGLPVIQRAPTPQPAMPPVPVPAGRPEWQDAPDARTAPVMARPVTVPVATGPTATDPAPTSQPGTDPAPTGWTAKPRPGIQAAAPTVLPSPSTRHDTPGSARPDGLPLPVTPSGEVPGGPPVPPSRLPQPVAPAFATADRVAADVVGADLVGAAFAPGRPDVSSLDTAPTVPNLPPVSATQPIAALPPSPILPSVPGALPATPVVVPAWPSEALPSVVPVTPFPAQEHPGIPAGSPDRAATPPHFPVPVPPEVPGPVVPGLSGSALSGSAGLSGSKGLADLAAAFPFAGPVAVAPPSGGPPSGGPPLRVGQPALPPVPRRHDDGPPVSPTAPTTPVQRLSQALQAAVRHDGHGQPLAPGAQATLARLMGTSVADVRVVRNASVLPALQAARAEALTVGRTVFLSPDTRLDTPAGTALAAHEVTHALRRDQPSFVPEVLRRAPGPARPDAHDEEGVALATEHATYPASEPDRRPAPPTAWEARSWETDSPAPAPRPAARPPTSAPARPAPESQPFLPGVPPPAPAGGAWVHAAALDRPAAPAAAERQGDGAAVGRRAPSAPSVDLDQVAREVYARLRERLSTELRRV